MSAIFTEIQTLMRAGEAEEMEEKIRQALAQGHSAEQILGEGLLPAMTAIGEEFKNQVVFIPEVMLASRAMNQGLAMLKPLAKSKPGENGRAVIGTVQGDCHDIGKNIVKTMLEGRGIETIDLGVDVAAERYIEAAKKSSAQIICCSALLTTAMEEMRRVVELVKQEGLTCKVMIGGAVVSQAYCELIGADCYTPDAHAAAEAAVSLCQ